MKNKIKFSKVFIVVLICIGLRKELVGSRILFALTHIVGDIKMVMITPDAIEFQRVLYGIGSNFITEAIRREITTSIDYNPYQLFGMIPISTLFWIRYGISEYINVGITLSGWPLFKLHFLFMIIEEGKINPSFLILPILGYSIFPGVERAVGTLLIGSKFIFYKTVHKHVGVYFSIGGYYMNTLMLRWNLLPVILHFHFWQYNGICILHLE